MRILITGASGFVGQQLIPMLTSRFAIKYLLLSRNPLQLESKFSSLNISKDNLEFCDSENWDKITAFAPEVVIHLASYNSANEDEETINKLIESNLLFGIKLLEHICQNTRSLKLFINTGSFSQYVEAPDGKEIENAYFYSATKSAFEIFLNFFSKRYNFDYITAVPFSIYGSDKTVKRVIDYLLESLGSPFPIGMTKGEQILDFVHVKDVAEFYCNVIDGYLRNLKPKNGEKYFLGTGKGTNIRELAKILEDLTGKKCNIHWGEREYRKRDIMYAVAKLGDNPHTIAWKPRITLREGVKEYLTTKHL